VIYRNLFLPDGTLPTVTRRQRSQAWSRASAIVSEIDPQGLQLQQARRVPRIAGAPLSPVRGFCRVDTDAEAPQHFSVGPQRAVLCPRKVLVRNRFESSCVVFRLKS
jgi:hypothetical protein